MFTAKELFEQLLKAEKQGLVRVSLSYPVFKKEGLTSIALNIDIDDTCYIGKTLEEDRERVLLKHQLEQEQEEFKTNTCNSKTEKFTYLMVDNRNKLYKIGKSNNPSFREKTLQSEVPQIKLLSYCAEWIVSEKDLHKRFESKRIRGEWFRLNKHDVLTIKNLMQA